MSVVVSLAFFSIQAAAQLEGNPEYFCRNGAFPRESENYQIARIKGAKGERVYFYADDREDCPGAPDCRLKSYVIPNDEVIVSRTYGKFSCSWYQPRKGSETVGWVETDKLELFETSETPGQKAWLGKWSYNSNSIAISNSRTPGLFNIKGSAVWKGLGDNINIGGLNHQAKPAKNRLKFGKEDSEKYGCQVRMYLAGRFLIVSDNLQCGGANVSFSGVYLK
jgi:hypothetical protein